MTSILQVFEKWKKGHDQLLREKYRKQKEVENKLKQKKLETEEEHKINSKYAISDWSVFMYSMHIKDTRQMSLLSSVL